MEITETTFYRRRKKYCGLGVSELRELKQLREENCKLKSLVADLRQFCRPTIRTYGRASRHASKSTNWPGEADGLTGYTKKCILRNHERPALGGPRLGGRSGLPGCSSARRGTPAIPDSIGAGPD
jgi:hypothetical protein